MKQNNENIIKYNNLLKELKEKQMIMNNKTDISDIEIKNMNLTCQYLEKNDEYKRIRHNQQSQVFPYPICFISKSLPSPPKDYNLRKTGIDLMEKVYKEPEFNIYSNKLLKRNNIIEKWWKNENKEIKKELIEYKKKSNDNNPINNKFSFSKNNISDNNMIVNNEAIHNFINDNNTVEDIKNVIEKNTNEDNFEIYDNDYKINEIEDFNNLFNEMSNKHDFINVKIESGFNNFNDSIHDNENIKFIQQNSSFNILESNKILDRNFKDNSNQKSSNNELNRSALNMQYLDNVNRSELKKLDRNIKISLDPLPPVPNLINNKQTTKINKNVENEYIKDGNIQNDLYKKKEVKQYRKSIMTTRYYKMASLLRVIN